MNPPGVAAGHFHNVHIAEEDDHSRYEVADRSHERSVAGTAGPVDCTDVHGTYVADRAPAQEGRAAGGKGLQPDPQDHSTGPPQGTAGAVSQAIHDGVVSVQGNSSYCQHGGCTVHRGGATHIQAEVLSEKRGGGRNLIHKNIMALKVKCDNIRLITFNKKATYIAIHPSVAHDGQSNKRHNSNGHQEVTDGQVHDQYRGHRVESLVGSHNDNDKNITCTDTHTATVYTSSMDADKTISKPRLSGGAVDIPATHCL